MYTDNVENVNALMCWWEVVVWVSLISKIKTENTIATIELHGHTWWWMYIEHKHQNIT